MQYFLTVGDEDKQSDYTAFLTHSSLIILVEFPQKRSKPEIVQRMMRKAQDTHAATNLYFLIKSLYISIFASTSTLSFLTKRTFQNSMPLTIHPLKWGGENLTRLPTFRLSRWNSATNCNSSFNLEKKST